MQLTWTRTGWTLMVVVAAIAIVAWPLAVGAGLTLSIAAVFAGLRAAAAVLLVIVVLLAAFGLRIDADQRPDPRPRPAQRSQ